MVQLVDGLNLATNVQLLDSLVQVDDSRVLGVTAEDKLTLLLPKNQGEKNTSAIRPTTKHEPPADIALRKGNAAQCQCRCQSITSHQMESEKER